MTLVPYQPDLVEEIAARLDLRQPNRRALGAVARALDGADEPGVEMVCDLATATGKSYIAAGIVDYLAASGHRNVLVVCHRTAILSKTRRNFTPGDSKYVQGLESRPDIITVDNFRRGGVGQAMGGSGANLLYLFNVQQLLQPRGEMRRRTRDYDENLGASLYEHLAGIEDLVVIADEHHVYFGPEFSRSIRELHPLALIGLTATPHRNTSPESIVFRYPLAEAIADGYVKIPVLVGRRDGTSDTQRILADGVRLLDIKQRAIDTWAAATGREPVRAVMFLVCETIEEADDLAALLSSADYLGSTEAVLTVTSASPEEALVALDGIEDQASLVRAVVSVQMLQEGWDVKNIYVVATTRALESQALSEQILGRGLRLPFGVRTGQQMLDTVEVLSHRRFRELLASADVMLEAFFHERRSAVIAPDGQGPAGGEQETGRADAVVLPSGASQAAGGAPKSEDGSTFGMELVDAGTRLAEVEQQTLQLSREVHLTPGAPRFKFPRLKSTLRPVTFTLSDVDSGEATELGRRFTGEIAATLRREVLGVDRVDDETGEGVRVSARTAADQVEATQLNLGLDDLRERLRGRILDSRYVERTRRESRAVDRLINAFLAAAGVDDDASVTWGEARVQAAADSFLAMVRVRHLRRPSSTVEEVELVKYPPVGVPAPAEVFNRGTPFVRHRWYDGWNRNVLPVARFDAKSTEFALADMLDTDAAISWWCRIETAEEVRIPLEGTANYFPDFLAVDGADGHWLIEGKSDSAAEDSEVLAKRRAAERWVRHVNDSGDAPHTWRYLFATEAAIRGAAGSWPALLRLAHVT